METIREWISRLTPSQKKKPGKAVVDNLFKMIDTEIHSPSPNYDDCVFALTTFGQQLVGIFYGEEYVRLPKDLRTPFDAAFLKWAESRPKVAGSNIAYLKMAQVLKKRLSIVDSAEELVPELKWYISNFDDARATSETMKFQSECELADLQKLLALDVSDWRIDAEKVKKFYGILFSSFSGAATKSLYQAFLVKNHLVDSAKDDNVEPSQLDINKAIVSSKHTAALNSPTPKQEDVAEKAPSTTALPSETLSSPSAQSMNSDKIVDVRKDTEDEVADKTSSLAEKPMVHNLPEPPTASYKESSDLSPEISQPEPDPDKDGVKLAERLLAWAKTQVQGVSILKSSLKTSNNDLKRLEDRFSNLQSELFAAKEEIAAKEVTITALQHDLAAAQARLESEQAKSAELDGMISKLQQMNENTATQAVLGYKAELASALKSIVEDTRLPEAQHDSEILSALLADLLDTLHFKGVPLEVDEK